MMMEQQESLGHYLRKEREQKNISLEQVAYATRINLKMLNALEDDDHNSLPAQTFVRGYLQAYAKYVKMDTQDVLLRYQHLLATTPVKQRSALKSHYVYVKERYQEKRQLLLIITLFTVFLISAGTYFVLKSKRDHRKALAQQNHSQQNSADAAAIVDAQNALIASVRPPYAPTALGVQAAAATAAKDAKDLAKTAAAAKLTAEKETKPESTPPVTPTPALATPATPAAPAAVATPAPATVATAPATTPPAASTDKKNFILSLKAKEDVWFRFQTDEDPIRDLRLKEDKTMILKANTVIKVFSGNLNAFQAIFNGKEIPQLAPNAKVKSLVLPQSEIANYPLPLFPQFQKKEEPKTDVKPQN